MYQIERVAQPDGNRKWWVLAGISLALFMVFLDVTIVNIALPSIMKGFRIDLSSIEWLMNVYVLVFATLLLTSGKLGDLFGRKRLFIIGIAVFTLASAVCSLSPNFTWLLISRGIQALGSAAMVPATLSILNVEFSQKQRGLALGIWGAVAGVANALGPIIGGALVDAISWRYIFVINIPIGIIVLLAAIKIIRESTDSQAERHIDMPGVVSITLALFCLTFALVEGQSYGWTSATILSLFAVALASFIAFIIIELRTASPLAELRLFRDRSFTAGNTVGLVMSFGLIGVVFLLVLYLQIILKVEALKAGLWILPMPLALIFVAPFAGRLTDRIGGRWIIFMGTIFSAIGLYLLTDLSGVTAWTDLLSGLILTGVGMGMVMAPVTTVIMSSTPTRHSGMGAGIYSTTRQIGIVLGLSVLGAVLQNQLVSNITRAVSQLSSVPAALREKIIEVMSSGNLNAGGVDIPANVPPTVSKMLMEMFNAQFAASLSTAMRIGVFVVLIAVVASLFISGSIKTEKTASEKETADIQREE